MSISVMLPVLARFGGSPVAGEAGMFFDFSRMRGATTDITTTTTTPFPEYLVEREWVFSLAPHDHRVLAAVLGICNFLGALWLVVQIPYLSLFTPFSQRLLSGLATTLFIYAILFLLLPLFRWALYAHLNEKISKRNFHRQELAEEYNNQLGEEGSCLRRKVVAVDVYREKQMKK